MLAGLELAGLALLAARAPRCGLVVTRRARRARCPTPLMVEPPRRARHPPAAVHACTRARVARLALALRCAQTGVDVDNDRVLTTHCGAVACVQGIGHTSHVEGAAGTAAATIADVDGVEASSDWLFLIAGLWTEGHCIIAALARLLARVVLEASGVAIRAA